MGKNKKKKGRKGKMKKSTRDEQGMLLQLRKERAGCCLEHVTCSFAGSAAAGPQKDTQWDAHYSHLLEQAGAHAIEVWGKQEFRCSACVT
jgi:hypothetical protein